MDEPTVTLEAGRVRAEVDGKSYLLRLPSLVAFQKVYGAALAAVAGHFTPDRTRAAGLSQEHAAPMQRAIAMHWLYQYSVNRQPILLTAADLKHAATRRIVYEAARSACADEASAAQMAGQLSGLSPEQFARWLDADSRQRTR